MKLELPKEIKVAPIDSTQLVVNNDTAKVLADTLPVVKDGVKAPVKETSEKPKQSQDQGTTKPASTEKSTDKTTIKNTQQPSNKATIVDQVTIQKGHTLRNISLKYYGNKSFWVYIYEANKGKIKNPNNVPLGTKLAIPSLKNYGVDPKDPKEVEKAKVMEKKLLTPFN